MEHTLEAGKSLVDIYARMLDADPEADQAKPVESTEITPAALLASKAGL